jgi:hypothetical protein
MIIFNILGENKKFIFKFKTLNIEGIKISAGKKIKICICMYLYVNECECMQTYVNKNNEK